MFTPPSFNKSFRNFWQSSKEGPDSVELNNIISVADKKNYSLYFLNILLKRIEPTLKKFSEKANIEDSQIQEKILAEIASIQFEIDILTILIKQIPMAENNRNFYVLLVNFINVNREAQAAKFVAIIAAKCLNMDISIEIKDLAPIVEKLEEEISKFDEETAYTQYEKTI